MKSLVMLCTLLALTLGVTFNSLGAPANDNFANRAALVGTEHFLLADNFGATWDAGEPNHAAQGGNSSVWWRWTAPLSGFATIDTTGSSNRMALCVYTGSAVNALTPVAANYLEDINSASGSHVGFTAVSGQQYQIAVDSGPSGDATFILYLRAGALTGNDAFANATVIAPGTLAVNGNNLNASRETGEPEHIAFVDSTRSAWWRWTASSNGPVTLDTAGTTFPAILAVYTGNTLASLSPVAAAQGFQENPEVSVTLQAISGVTYQIAVDTAQLFGQITLNFRQRPPNDNFANRIALTGSTFTAFGENRGATEETGEPNHAFANGTKSVWWRWTAPSSGTYTLDTIGSSFVPALAVYTGSTLSGLVPIANMDGSQASASRVRFSATSGTTYQIAVDSEFGNNKGGNIILNMAPAQPLPTNDFFANRITLTQLPATVSGSNIGTTEESGEDFDFRDWGTVWWRFVASANGLATVRKISGVPNLRLVAAEGTSVSGLTILADSADFNTFPERYDCSMSFSVRAGSAYSFSVSSLGLDQGDFTVSVSMAGAATNDNFANRIILASQFGTVTGSTLGATLESGEPARGSNSVWWSYTPAASGPVILTTVGSAIDTVLAVYTGTSVSALSQVALNDSAYVWPVAMGPFFDRPSRLKFNGLAGQAYRIAVSTASNTAPGDVMLNFPSIAIEDIVSISNTIQTNRTMTFTANLRLTNLKPTVSGPLRLRLFARAGYSHIDGLRADCGKRMPALTDADQELTITNLAGPGYLSAQSSLVTAASGVCPPPYEAGDYGTGWGAMAVLEELTDNGWELRDVRLLVFGNWPRVGGFVGPGGGVITVASGLGQVLSTPGFIDLSIGPPAALRLGARWRVSPTNFGSLFQYTNFSTQSVILATRDNNFSIDITNLAGFTPPTNRFVRVRAGLHTNLDLTYSVNPPRLFYSRTGGLSATGTVGTAYRIEAASRLQPPNWTSNAGRTLTAGQNAIANTTPVPGTNRYYRAFWLSD